MRPTYETSTDLNKERLFIDEICDWANVTARKLPIRYQLDFALFRNERLDALAEIKIRTFEYSRFPDMYISLTKFKAAHDMSELTGVPSFLFVKWTDYWGLIKLSAIGKGQPAISWNGRKDRGDDQDMDLQVHFPITWFLPQNYNSDRYGFDEELAWDDIHGYHLIRRQL